MGVRCGVVVGLASYLSKVKTTCASSPSVLRNPPRPSKVLYNMETRGEEGGPSKGQR